MEVWLNEARNLPFYSVHSHSEADQHSQIVVPSESAYGSNVIHQEEVGLAW